MSTQSLPNTQSRANAATLRNLHHMCLGSGHSPSPVDRADCMCLHGRPCVWLPFAAPCCYTLFYLLMMPAARLVCQRPSSTFPYFRTPLANFLLSRPNSLEYGNSKTTTLLPSAKCTRPLFQGRTVCGGRPSGWHDIVTCQHLVIIINHQIQVMLCTNFLTSVTGAVQIPYDNDHSNIDSTTAYIILSVSTEHNYRPSSVWKCSKKVKVKERIVLREIHTRTTGRHLSIGSHSITYHPTEVTAPPSPQPGRLVLDWSTPQGWKAELA